MKKICFIACVNNDLMMNECCLYIDRLFIPDGWSVEVIRIKEASSMAEGYNAAMNATDADIKVYLHQDVFIINRHFLENIIKIFESDPKIGIIGMAGVQKLPKCGVMWRGKYRGSIYMPMEERYEEQGPDEVSSVLKAACVDGFCMATSKNVYWREDFFKGFDFYDISESFEYRRKGYRVVIPEQSAAWCVHDDGKLLTLFEYNKNRKIFLNEYGKDSFTAVESADNCEPENNDDYIEMLSDIEEKKFFYIENQDAFIDETEKYLEENDINGFISMDEKVALGIKNKKFKLSKDIVMVKMLSSTVLSEKNAKIKTFIDGVSSFSMLKEKWLKLGMYLRRIEFDFSDDLLEEGFNYISENNISAYSVAVMIYGTLSYLGHREKIMLKIAEYYLDRGNILLTYHFLSSIVEPSAETKELMNELRNMVVQ
ncbi:Glycosyltransferase like family protein [Lachnospiraceae bacterium KH1T2]|nr:Glycosyltransferase like family protein [Lachnospiraceae bacterium KH1T2]